MKPKISILLLSAMLILGFGCKKQTNSAGGAHDFPEIKDKGSITVLTLSGSMSYFLYKGEVMGYEYELLKSFSEANGLKLNLVVAPNEVRLQEMLLDRKSVV